VALGVQPIGGAVPAPIARQGARSPAREPRAPRPPARTQRALAGVLGAALSLSCTSCLLARMVYFNAPSLAAPTYFEERSVRASSRPVPFARWPAQASFEGVARAAFDGRSSFDDLVADNDTRALVVLQHGAIVYERYFGGVTAGTLLPAFSMSKTFAAVLLGAAQRDGLVASVDERLVDFVPALAARPGYRDITIEHLLRMTSGIDFEEESVSGGVLYYTADLRARTLAYDVRWPPGRHYQYGSIMTGHIAG
jgi:CubicO group peptidase (beta-lactamase class C family)